MHKDPPDGGLGQTRQKGASGNSGIAGPRDPDPDGRGDASTVSIGRISAAHGLRGELKAFPLTHDPERFKTLRTVWLADGDEEPGERHAVESVRLSGSFALIKLKGIDDRTAAESVTGRWIRIRRSQCRTLPAGSYYLFELIGLKAVTAAGETVGTVREVLKAPGQDILVIDREGEDVLVPMVKEWIRSVDPPAGIVTVTTIEGLI
ncbi:16S rRNA processing protein RimM [bacterium]|nr:16S rRNA processing protein RimM [bacterium]